ncbi:MAG: tetratricopeptide repeat protein [Rickettsiales endosymbiont of Dermacentor nuttalli]
MSDIFAEIDKELKQEQLIKAISKYIPCIIIAIILAVILTISKIAWSSYNIKLQEKASNIFNTTLSLNKSDEKIINESLDYLISLNQKNIFSSLASFYKANLELEKNNKTNALQLYNNIYNNKNTNPIFKQLAGLTYITNATDITKDNRNLYFVSLNNIQGPFNALINLEKALFLLDNGDKNVAIDILEKLKNDNQNSYFIHKRAEEILAIVSLNQ